MKLTRGLPLLAENQVYLNGLILENFSTEEVDAIVKEVESISLEKSEFSQENFLYCICCGKAKRKLDGGGMCNECFRDYRLKLSKFLTKPIGNMPFF